MKRLELLQKLKRQGAVFARHGAKHDVYRQPLTNKEATPPPPRHDEINEYTAKAIQKTFLAYAPPSNEKVRC
ncbi:MAG: type II toxin-antitoxin system HicA family toxin [Spirochaetaceae bacterium]|jgi:mRNA interferase HicA|nr:type II toxin-antitoxin system HicA family toxin [Spirochaetaceae bacterium]